MADFRIKLGVDVDTGNISSTIKNYKAKPIEVSAKLNTDKIDSKIKNFKAPKQIELVAKLNTSKIDDKIKNFTAKKQIEVSAKLNTKDIDSVLNAYQPKNSIKVNVELDNNGINEQIKNYKASASIEVDAKLKKDAIDEQIRNFQTKVPVKVNLTLDTDDINKKISEYEVRSQLRVKVKINKDDINQQISKYDENTYITVNAKLDNGAINEAIRNYKAKTPIKLDLTLDHSDIDKKVKAYKAGNPVELTARIKLNAKDIAGQLQQHKITVPVELIVAKLDATDIDKKIGNYKANQPIVVGVKLDDKAIVGQIKSFKTNTPIEVEAKLKDGSINQAIAKFKPSTPINIDLKLNTKDVNAQVQKLAKPTEPVSVDVTLDESSINAAIALFKPTATLGIKPDLIVEDIDDQIRAYTPKAQVKVNVKLDDDNIDEKVGKQNLQAPIQVDVKLNRENINEQIRNFTTKTKVKVGVKLDFASHKDDSGKEIQKGISQQLKEFETKSKVRVGVELDRDSIAQEVNNISVDTPIRLGVELDPNGVQNVQNQIDNLRQRIQALGNININLGGNGFGSGAGGNGNGAGGGRGGRRDNDVTRAYRELIRLQNRISKKQQSISILDTSENPREILELSNQISNLTRRYQELRTQFSASFSPIQVDNINNGLQVLSENLNIVNRKAADARAELARSINIKLESGDFERQLAIVENGIGGLVNVSGDVQRELNNVRTALREVEEAYASDNIDALIAANERYEASLRAVKNQLDINKVSNTRDKQAFDVIGGLVNSDFDNQVDKINRDFNKLSTQSDEARTAVSLLNQALADMKSAANRGDIDGLIRANERYVESLKYAKNQIAMQQRDDKDFAATYKDDADELQAIADKLKKTKIRIAGLDEKSNTNEIAKLRSDLKELEATYESLRTKLQGKLSSNQFSSLYKSAEETKNALELIESQLKDTKENLAGKINLKLNDGTFDNEISNITSKFDKLRDKSDSIKVAMNEVNAALSKMKNASGSGNVDKLIEANQQYEKALKAVKNQLDINARAEKDNVASQKLVDKRNEFMSSIDAWLTKNSAAVDRFGDAMLELKAKAENCDKVTLDNLKTQFKQLDAEADAAGLKMQSFGDRIKAQFKKYSAYFGVAELFMYVEQGLRDMFQQVVAIDTAMTELKKVTNETDASYDKFLSNAASRAKEIGTTIDGLVSSTADFARLGYNFEQSQGLAEVANIYTVVGDEIDGVEDATQSLVSTLAAFKHEIGDMSDSDFAMSIVDKMNEVANNYSISSGGIGEALQRSASSMAAANNTLDETIAMITAANEVAQNPEKVGK